jgi:hypothetical protein
VPDEELVRLTGAARVAGNNWPTIATACGVRTYQDTVGVVAQPSGIVPSTGAGILFRATQYSLWKLIGTTMRYPPLTWQCPGCEQQVTDRTATGRPVHIEHGHGEGCVRLALDQTADDAERRHWLPRKVKRSRRAGKTLQRHQLDKPVIDDCPRCGWHGYFHEYVTVDGDWTNAICDGCAADLHPNITVTVTFCSARLPGRRPHAVIRQRARTDRTFRDPGQMMTWQLFWEHTTMLLDDERGNCSSDIEEISCADAEQIMARLAAEYWPADAARLPWVAHAYPP